MEVVYFIVLVGVLIFVHELGHFVWAKFFGVQILKFSLGFGPKIAGFTWGGTEYVIAAFPLGGYVRMLGESPHDEIAEKDQGKSFSEQSLLRRVIIVFAGPRGSRLRTRRSSPARGSRSGRCRR
ncbi:site-2 protease family protein [bacterium AH-315-N03]|nr:site-2 protease family protein [bacterium AH-315-N03]